MYLFYVIVNCCLLCSYLASVWCVLGRGYQCSGNVGCVLTFRGTFGDYGNMEGLYHIEALERISDEVSYSLYIADFINLTTHRLSKHISST